MMFRFYVMISFSDCLCFVLMQHLFGIIASVLHLGNLKFEADARGYATIKNNQEMHWVSKVNHLSVMQQPSPVYPE